MEITLSQAIGIGNTIQYVQYSTIRTVKLESALVQARHRRLSLCTVSPVLMASDYNVVFRLPLAFVLFPSDMLSALLLPHLRGYLDNLITLSHCGEESFSFGSQVNRRNVLALFALVTETNGHIYPFVSVRNTNNATCNTVSN